MVSRLTQRDIARIARVSQTTVSVVLNGREVPGIRISPQTRTRVLRVIRETGYVADPIARRLAAQHNQILGVFTYEPVFPTASADFFHPFLEGIEDSAGRDRYDLLLFTSARIESGRRIFNDNRLRLADGTLLLGRAIPHDELGRLIADDYPFACIGRRDDAGGPVPYVGADYASATAELGRRARALGHRAFAYIGPGRGAESAIDRFAGFQAIGGGSHWDLDSGTDGDPNPDTADLLAVLDRLSATGTTVAFVETPAVAAELIRQAPARGLRVPTDLSVVTLGDPADAATDRALTGFHIPRREMGRQAVDVLAGILTGTGTATQRLLDCEIRDGTTLIAPTETRRNGT